MAKFRERLGRWLLGKSQAAGMKVSTRMYSNARASRSTVGFGMSGNTSADAELSSSLTQLRARSRQMVRDNPYARRAKSLVVNNVIGPGVGMQAQVVTSRDELSTRVNDEIEQLWREWCAADSCHTGGKLHFNDIERVAFGQIFEAGEILLRKHFTRFGESRVPLALEVIEAERLASEFDVISAPSGNQVRMGVEQDRFGRPVAYYMRIKHPGDVRYGAGQAAQFERVPADEVFHLHLCDRWPQTRGEPWMHTVLAKLDLMNEYSAAEVQAARDSAFYFATVKSDPDVDGNPTLSNTTDSAGAPTYEIASGVIQHLEPGEELTFHTPNRPNTAIDAFLRYMLREVAAGIGPSYAALSQDYSQSNYSSSRLALLDDRDCWRVFQQWWIRAFRLPLHRIFMQQAVLAEALKSVPIELWGPARRKYEAVLFKPRGWSWIDPAKEVSAFREAEKAGYITKTQVISQTGNGMDVEDYITERERELKLFEAAGIITDTVPEKEPPAPAPEPAEEPEEEEEEDETAAKEEDAERKAMQRQVDRLERQVDLQSALRLVPTAAPVNMTIEPNAIAVSVGLPAITVERTAINIEPAAVNVAPAAVNIAPAAVHVAPAAVHIDQPATVLNVAAPEVRIEQAPAVVNVTMPEQPATVLNVAAPEVRIEQAPAVINVAAPEVRIEQAPVTFQPPPIELHLDRPRGVTVEHEHDANGELVRSTSTYDVEPATIPVDPIVRVRVPHPRSAVIEHERDEAGQLVRSVTQYEE